MEEIIFKYFPELSDEQKRQIAMLYPLYKEWNSKINTISRKDIDQLYLHHVLHSLAIANIIQFSIDQKVIDIGTGGGFPGIPLAILFPETSFTLCDSILKKIRVVEDISGALGLNNVTPLCCRAETIEIKFDYIVSRAVTELKKFMPLVKNIYKEGVIYLKGGDIAQEVADCVRDCKIAPNRVHITNISEMFNEEYFIGKKILFIER